MKKIGKITSCLLLLFLFLFRIVIKPKPVFAVSEPTLINVNKTGLNSSPIYLIDVNGTLYFTANNGTNGVELWKSDGTDAGTVMVKDIYSGSSSSTPQYLTNVNGTLYFRASNVTNGQELWKSDGTDAGTVMVKDIYTGSNGGSPSNLTNVNGTLYFQATNGTNGAELWKSDGTDAGTVMVKDIYSGSSSSSPGSLTDVNGTLYFQATNGTNGVELWKSDGTNIGTVMVKDIYTGSSSGNPTSLTNVNGTLYFAATNGTNGVELWKSDGTDGGTVMVKDIRTGSNGSTSQYLTNINGILYFQANDGTNGVELWKSDGTDSGTVMVKDICPGSTTSNPAYITNMGDKLFFNATDLLEGTELWVYDYAAKISSLNLTSPGSSDTTISWITDELASSIVDWGLTSSYGSSTPETDTSTRVLNHSISLSGLSSCTRYHYRVRSFDSGLNETASADGTFTTVGCPALPETCKDSVPSGNSPWLYEASSTKDTITLEFTNYQSPVDRFALEYGTEPGNYIFAADRIGDGKATSYTVNYLQPNTTYYFRVRGGNGCATGAWSNEITVKTKSSDYSLNSKSPDSSEELKISNLTIQPKEKDKEGEKKDSCQEYIVKAGDTLSKIASSILGDGGRYQEIIDGNKDQYPSLESSLALSVGWKLKLNCQGSATTTDKEETQKLSYIVNVKVQDNNNKPVVGAKVTLHSEPQTETTDVKGIARFTNVERGNHTVEIAYNNYQGEKSINLEGDTSEFDISITIELKQSFPNTLVLPVILFLVLLVGILTFALLKKRRSVVSQTE